MEAMMCIVLLVVPHLTPLLLTSLCGVQRKFVAVTTAILTKIKGMRLNGTAKIVTDFFATMAEMTTAFSGITHTM